jgi:hypothetical protein
MISRPGQLAVAPTQPFLRLPRGVEDRHCQTLLAQQLVSADACREPITSGRLDQHSLRRAIPGFRDPVLAACGAARALRRNQTEMSRRGLAGPMMSLSSATTIAAATRAIPRSACRARTTGGQRPIRQRRLDMGLQMIASRRRHLDRGDAVFLHDLMRRIDALLRSSGRSTAGARTAAGGPPRRKPAPGRRSHDLHARAGGEAVAGARPAIQYMLNR